MVARLPNPERHRSIVDAAIRCFAERGFAGTTTRTLARAAGVSEALVFRHFPDKKALYTAILERKFAVPEPGYFPEEAAARGDDRLVLESIASTLLRRVDADPSFLRLMTFSGLEGNPLPRMFYEGRGSGMFRFLAAYLGRRIKVGAMRTMDPRIAARAFLGMVMQHLNGRHVLRFPERSPGAGKLVRTWVDLFLGGMRR